MAFGAQPLFENQIFGVRQPCCRFAAALRPSQAMARQVFAVAGVRAGADLQKPPKLYHSKQL
jgi:hypothetical protein